MNNIASLESDARIIERFLKMDEEDIEAAFKKEGGRIALVGFINHRPSTEVSRRDDGWTLEVRNARAGGAAANDVWLRPTNRANSVKERMWVNDWLLSLGFDELEAYVYFASNIPHKRHIARHVGAALAARRKNKDADIGITHNYVGDAVVVVTNTCEDLAALVGKRCKFKLPVSVPAAV